MASPAAPGFVAPSQGTWVSGPGRNETSGTPVAYAEYTQWATIDYARNPETAGNNQTTEYRSLGTLSSSDNLEVFNTNLHYEMTVHNSCKILYGNFTYQSYYQPQKFAILGNNTCKAGYTYDDNAVFGTASGIGGASGLYLFGPQGSIITTQPYIRRHVSGVNDTAYALTQKGCSEAVLLTGPPTYTWGASNLAHKYDYFMGGDWNSLDICPGSEYPFYDGQPYPGGMDWYQMYGAGYMVSSEAGYLDNTAGLARLIKFIEGNLDAFNAPTGTGNWAVQKPKYSDGSWILHDSDLIPHNPYYNTSFHDYT